MTRERVQPYVIRTEKRRAIDADGKPLFMPRLTKLMPVAGEAARRPAPLYEAVTEYVRQGYNQAMREKRHYIGFLMILMQRLVTSSTQAIATTLERRLSSAERRRDLPATARNRRTSSGAELDGQEQLDNCCDAPAGAAEREGGGGLLLELARRCRRRRPTHGPRRCSIGCTACSKRTSDPELKFLIFTEFVPTQEMLRDFLEQHGFSVACLNGSMDMEQRRRVQREFAGEARVLVSTDAGGEGSTFNSATSSSTTTCRGIRCGSSSASAAWTASARSSS